MLIITTVKLNGEIKDLKFLYLYMVLLQHCFHSKQHCFNSGTDSFHVIWTLKLIESSIKLNVVYSYRTIVL